MPTLADLKAKRRFKALFKGPPVTRKTVAALSYMSIKRDPPSRAYVFDWDDKIDSILNAGFEIHGDIEFHKYGAHNLQSATQKMRDILSLQSQNKNPYDLILWDSLSSTSDALCKYSWDWNTSDNKKKAGEIWLPGLQEFNAESCGMADVVAFFNQLNCNCILTAHVIEVEKTCKSWNAEAKQVVDEVIIEKSIITAGRKLAEKLPGKFKEIWHFGKQAWPDPSRTPRYFAMTRASGEDYAATTLPLDPKIFFDDGPLWPKIVEQCKAKGVEIG